MFNKFRVRIPAPDTGWTFFTLLYSFKNCTVCSKRLKNGKEAGNGPYLKNSPIFIVTVFCQYLPMPTEDFSSYSHSLNSAD